MEQWVLITPWTSRVVIGGEERGRFGVWGELIKVGDALTELRIKGARQEANVLINKTSVPRRRPGGELGGAPAEPRPSDPLIHNFSPEACSGWGSEPGRTQARFGKLLVGTEAQTVPPRVPRPVTGGEPRGESYRPELRAASRRKGLAWVLTDERSQRDGRGREHGEGGRGGRQGRCAREDKRLSKPTAACGREGLGAGEPRLS